MDTLRIRDKDGASLVGVTMTEDDLKRLEMGDAVLFFDFTEEVAAALAETAERLSQRYDTKLSLRSICIVCPEGLDSVTMDVASMLLNGGLPVLLTDGCIAQARQGWAVSDLKVYSVRILPDAEAERKILTAASLPGGALIKQGQVYSKTELN